MNDRQNYDLGELIMKSLGGTASESDSEQLGRILNRDIEALDYYMDYVSLCAYLESPGNVSFQQSDDSFDMQAWQLLAEYEKTAPEAEIEKPVRGPVKMLKVEKPPRVINKFSLYSAIISVAAFFILLAYVRFFPASRSYETATIVDSIDAVWSNSNGSILQDGRLMTNQVPLKLEKGIAKIVFDNQARIILEAPAEFGILTNEQIQLNYGRLFVHIPQEALGFSVNTPNSKVVDLGTEFAVEVDTLSNTELHVLRGKTNLYHGIGKSKEMIFVGEGAAKMISGSTNRVVDIPCQKTEFIRQIDSKNHIIWKGQGNLDLADIVNGGNGFGTGRQGFCIEPSTGRFTALDSILTDSWKIAWDKEHSYLCEVPDLPIVDCVIVPSKRGGNLPLTTTGLSVPNFPELMGNLRWPIQTQTYNEKYPLTLNGQTYGIEGRSALLVHANCGITFDLNRIRQNIPGVDVVAFKTICGVNESRIAGNFDPKRTAEIYVFLDGEQVFYQSLRHVENNAVPIEIDLRQRSPRFMTLLVSCGEFGNDLDWCVFGTPELKLESR